MNKSILKYMKLSQSAMAITLQMIGFIAVNILIALGIISLLFIAIGNFTFDGTMHQLANLAEQFNAATSDRQFQFQGFFITLFAVVFTASIFFRRSNLWRIIRSNNDVR